MRLEQLPIGARVLEPDSGLVFVVADRVNGHYPGVTMVTERITTVACFDAAEPERSCAYPWDGYDRFGCNSYRNSNIHQWLNSAEERWYSPAHPLDTAPEAERTRYGEQPNAARSGFLCRFSKAFRSALLEVDVPALERTGKDQGELTTVKAKLFLPSRTEIIKGDESGFAEGAPLPLFYDPDRVHRIQPTEEDMARYGRSWNPAREDAPFDAPQIYDPKFSWWYYLRTPSLRYGFLVRVMSAYGAVSYTYANNDVVGIRPLCCLDPKLEVELYQPMRATDQGVQHRLYRITV